VAAVVAMVGSVGVPAEAAGQATPAWHSYVLGPSTPQVAPVGAESWGSVSHLDTLVKGKGKATTLTTVAGRTPASVVLDFGKDVAGTPYLDVTAVEGAPTLTLVTGEARQFLRRPASTTVAAAAAGGATEVILASAANLEVGNAITFGTGADTQTRTIVAFDTTAKTVSFSPGLSQDLPAGTAVSTSPGAPSSDESRGLAGVGGPDTLQPNAAGRVSGSFHGGFRFVLLTLSSPGSVSISSAGVDFQAYRATPDDYKGWFLSSDHQLNRMWYSGAYTLQLDMKPAGVNGLPDLRIFDGAKRDRSIWTGDLLVQGPTVLSTLGDVGAAYLKSSLNVLLSTQRADGALPGSPDFAKGRSPGGFPLFYSTTTPGTLRGQSSTTTATPATRPTSPASCPPCAASSPTTTPSSTPTTWWRPTTATTGRRPRPARSPSTASTTTSCSGRSPGSSARSAPPPRPTATTPRPTRSRRRSTPGSGTPS
jgi:hypothetical protein